MPPLSFPSEVRSLIGELGEAIPAGQRPKFLERVLALLAGDEVLSLGKVSAACAKAQHELLFASPTDDPPAKRPTRPQVRSPWRRRA